MPRRLSWRRDTRGVAFYALLPVFMATAFVLALAAGTLQSVLNARQAMRRYEQIALQQVADHAVTVAPTSAQEWSGSTTLGGSAAEAAFSNDLKHAIAGTHWQGLSVTVTDFQVITSSQIGQPAPRGYPTATYTAPGYYVNVQFAWPLDLLPFAGNVTLSAAEVMQANVFSAPNQNFNPNPS